MWRAGSLGGSKGIEAPPASFVWMSMHRRCSRAATPGGYGKAEIIAKIDVENGRIQGDVAYER